MICTCTRSTIICAVIIKVLDKNLHREQKTALMCVFGYGVLNLALCVLNCLPMPCILVVIQKLMLFRQSGVCTIHKTKVLATFVIDHDEKEGRISTKKWVSLLDYVPNNHS